MCVYGLGRAVRRALDPADDASLGDLVAQELDMARRFSNALLQQLQREAPEISTELLGEGFLVSCLCRLQGTLFVPSSEALRLTVTAFVARTSEGGHESVRAWLTGGDVMIEAARTP